MDILLNYQKRKNQTLFKNLENHHGIQLSNLQNYIPIYQELFSLNHTNYNSINLNHLWAINEIKDKEQLENNYANVFRCVIQNSQSKDISFEQQVFFKMAPLLDPFKYIVGKYDDTNPFLFTLPSLENNEKVHPKMLDTNNSSYVDGFFVFLTSQLLNCKKFIHGVDYYGSFLAIKHNFKLNIIDDLDYLMKSDFFNKQQNKLFKVDDFSYLVDNYNNSGGLIPIKIHNDSNKSVSNISVKSIDTGIFENIFENPNSTNTELLDSFNPSIDLIDISNLDITELKCANQVSIKSTSTCSSRTSHTHTEDHDVDVSNDDEDVSDNNSLSNTDSNDKTSQRTDESSYDEEEEAVYAYIPRFPVQVICMENCENTFDNLILNENLTKEEWFSAFMQIIMMLITYQQMFSFTHNDLHTNNIMYNTTSTKFIYYLYNKTYYKVPTFGRIYKIIDFGRAIYKFQGKTFCSDSFQIGGDASTQYNTEPYFNDKKPRLEPNYSFDLCRLACSIFDYIVEDFDNLKNLEKKDPVVKLIVEWCLDDNGLNVLYKNNGTERYPDFKLYKMIARFVHKHTPVAQLQRPEFKKYIIKKTNLPKDAIVINIDNM
uniref:Protein kinase domain-containing protein n=1 Tax=viral metagenome TaxID=1070528 RepID=A0A6C0E2X9_9ZZZZ